MPNRKTFWSCVNNGLERKKKLLIDIRGSGRGIKWIKKENEKIERNRGEGKSFTEVHKTHILAVSRLL